MEHSFSGWKASELNGSNNQTFRLTSTIFKDTHISEASRIKWAKAQHTTLTLADGHTLELSVVHHVSCEIKIKHC